MANAPALARRRVTSLMYSCRPKISMLTRITGGFLAFSGRAKYTGMSPPATFTGARRRARRRGGGRAPVGWRGGGGGGGAGAGGGGAGGGGGGAQKKTTRSR